MAKILDGQKLAQKILADIKKEIREKPIQLKLVVVQVGDNLASEIYIAQKQKASRDVGIDFELFRFPSDIDSEELKTALLSIVQNPANSGIIVQLPLPKHINVQDILNIIPPEKDIDVLSEQNMGKFYAGNSEILPPVVSAISSLFKKYNIKLAGKSVLVVGSGRLVGKPLSIWLMQQAATVSVANSATNDLSYLSRNADIVISGVGKSNLITKNMIKKGTVVIDAGTSVESGKSKGDVDFKNVQKKAGFITPVPGGVGPLTVAYLLKNLLILNQKSHEF